MEQDELILECAEKMAAAHENFEKALSTLRAGRVSAATIADVKADYYGEKTPVTYIASITNLQANVLVIKPFDRNDLKAIITAINEANLGVNPINDGDSIRLVFPTLTEDRRRDLVKTAKKYGEEAKVAVRNVRRDFMDKVKKDKDLPEDIAKSLENDIQKETDDAVKAIDASVAKKEKEIMEI
ncbi:MAG: ribosome recycling factor [Erysipelotrichales bacterium]|nr:ribosome recycling factor [Erysipelotrichales bacterium]